MAMRILLSLAHCLVGLIAIALVAGVAAWAWPDGERLIWPIAWAAMTLLAIATIYRATKKRALPQGESRG